jgi:signal transduction histidine kinase
MPAASLQRSVVALLDNAVKHSPAGAKVVVTARKEGAQAVIDVIDEGPGIQGIAPSRIFDRFARSADAVDGGGSSRTGFGIGLSLVQDTVARYGGTAQVSATSSAGTTITLRVPLFASRR